MVNVMEFKKIITDGINTGYFRADADVEMAIATIFGTKNYITNSSPIASKLLGGNLNDDRYMEGQLKPRIKKYLKEILKVYLLKK